MKTTFCLLLVLALSSPLARADGVDEHAVLLGTPTETCTTQKAGPSNSTLGDTVTDCDTRGEAANVSLSVFDIELVSAHDRAEDDSRDTSHEDTASHTWTLNGTGELAITTLATGEIVIARSSCDENGAYGEEGSTAHSTCSTTSDRSLSIAGVDAGVEITRERTQDSNCSAGGCTVTDQDQLGQSGHVSFLGFGERIDQQQTLPNAVASQLPS